MGTLIPYTHRKRRFCAAQIATRLVCIEQYTSISTGSKAARRVKSLVVSMPHRDKQCANFYVKDLTLNAERQRLRCAYALPPWFS